jgi:hypothetical protein
MRGGVTCSHHSASGYHFATGGADGAVRFFVLEQPFSLPDACSPYWEGQIHDMHCTISGVHVSADGRMLTAAATDGAMLTYHLDASAAVLRPSCDLAAPSPAMYASLADCNFVECEEPQLGSYTLEEAKQQLQLDKLQAAADIKKQSVQEELLEYVCLT